MRGEPPCVVEVAGEGEGGRDVSETVRSTGRGGGEKKIKMKK